RTGPTLVTVSAATEASLRDLREDLAGAIGRAGGDGLEAIARTRNTRRPRLPVRYAAAGTADEIVMALRSGGPSMSSAERPVVFLFGGHGRRGGPGAAGLGAWN